MQKFAENLNLKDLYEKKIFGQNALAVVGLSGIVLIGLKHHFNGTQNSQKRDLTGAVIIITGANTGIGVETGKELAKAGAQIILACRDEQRGKEAEKLVNQVRAGSAQFLKLDLSDLSSVRLFANTFKSQYNRLDVLVNNAGVMHIPRKQLTKDGFEMHFGVNHLGHFLLTNLLLDVLKKTPEFRVINVSARLHSQPGFDIEDLNFEHRPYSRFEAYSQSKLANILFTQSLQKIFDDQKINGKAVSLHPGVVRTELSRTYTGILGLIKSTLMPVFYLFSKSPLQGAQTTLHCICKDFNQLEKGQYFSDCVVIPTSSKQISIANRDRLWDISSKLVKIQ